MENLGERVKEDGFANVEDVLSAAVVDRLAAVIGEALRGGYAMRNLAEAVLEVQEAAGGKAVRGLLEPFFGSRAILVRSLFFDKTAKANWKVAWHQDLSIAVRERIETPGFTAWSVKDGVVHVQPPETLMERMLTVRLHLDDCGMGNGPLQVIPGSHTAGRLAAEQIRDWRERKSAVVCEVKRGGALLMRPLLLHASSEATEPKHRRVVHLEFAGESLPNGLEWLGAKEVIPSVEK